MNNSNLNFNSVENIEKRSLFAALHDVQLTAVRFLECSAFPTI